MYKRQLIEEGESDAASIAAYEKIVRDYFGDMPIGILHGKMKPKEKDAVMTDFAENRTKLLLSTTVVEVGVDVPKDVYKRQTSSSAMQMPMKISVPSS